MKRFTGVIICEGNSRKREREGWESYLTLRRRKGRKKERLVYVFRDCLVEFPVSII